MTAPHRSTNNIEPDLASDNAATVESTKPYVLPEPAPVSKHNLYVLIGCTILAVLMVIFGPQIYTFLETTNPFGFYR